MLRNQWPVWTGICTLAGDGRREVEFDEPLTPEEAKASETAWQAYLAGLDKGEPLEKVRRELLEEERG